jgi:hypothetical protein
MDLRLQPRHLLGKGVGHAAQRIAVHLDAGSFHPRQHRHQRAFQRLVDRRHLRPVQLRLEQVPQAQRDIGILGGIGRGLVDFHFVEGDLRLARADQLLDRDRLVAKVALGQRVHPVPMQPRIHRVGHQHRVVDGRHVDPVARQHLHVVLGVLPDLQDRGSSRSGLSASSTSSSPICPSARTAPSAKRSSPPPLTWPTGM